MDLLRKLLGTILYGLYMLLDAIGAPYLVLCIVLFTIIVRALMLPLTIKQSRSQKLSSVMNPEIQKVQAKYRGKKDRESMEKQQREMQVIYDKYGTSPTAGCLPLLITLPIFFALYSVISNMAEYIQPVKEVYENITNAIDSQSGNKKLSGEFTDFIKPLAEKYNSGKYEGKDLITVMQKFTKENWDGLKEIYKSSGNTYDVISDNSDKIMKMNRIVPGLTISDQPNIKNWPTLLIPILSVATQWISTQQMQAKQKKDNVNNKSNANNDNAAMQSMQTMTKVMPIMSGVMCYFVPLGVGIYWITGNLCMIAQQYFINKKLDGIDIDQMIKENVERSKGKKKSFSERLRQKMLDASEQADTAGNTTNNNTLKNYANINVRSTDLTKDNDKSNKKKLEKEEKIESESETVKKGSSSDKEVENKDNVKESKKGSISSYANIMSTNDTK